MRVSIPPVLAAAVACILCASVITPSVVRADPLPDSCLVRIRDYEDELVRAHRARRPYSLEPLWTKAQRVEAALLGSSDGSFAPLYALSEKEFDALRIRMRSFEFDREIHETARVREDSMSTLARHVGAPADTAFWNRIATFDSWGMPSYVEPITDETACTAFGTDRLVAAYAAWTTYRKHFPQSYAKDVAAHVDDVTRALLHDQCACGDSSSVVAEYLTFLKRFPKDPLAPRVRERLRDLRTGRARMRYHCLPG